MTTPAALLLWALASGPASLDFVVPGVEATYQPLIYRAADLAEVPRALALAVARTETGFDHLAVSREGSRGLFQILARDQAWLVAKYLGPWVLFDWRNPAQSALLGCLYLADLKRRFGSWELAVAAYNMGPTALAEGRVWPRETVEYVRRVLR